MDTHRTTAAPALLARLLWMMAGPIILALLAVAIAEQHGGWLALTSLAYLLILGVMMFARWFEFRVGYPMTATGEPATEEHLRRYVLITSIVGLAAWVLANVAGHIV